jgi:hypothetical protein
MLTLFASTSPRHLQPMLVLRRQFQTSNTILLKRRGEEFDYELPDRPGMVKTKFRPPQNSFFGYFSR